MRIYLTHCSATKDDALKGTDRKETPDRLYTATPMHRLMRACRERKVQWATFSALYGVGFPHEEHEW